MQNFVHLAAAGIAHEQIHDGHIHRHFEVGLGHLGIGVGGGAFDDAFIDGLAALGEGEILDGRIAGDDGAVAFLRLFRLGKGEELLFG